MKERPILYSAPMVLAKRTGRKTQTRRVMNPQPFKDPNGHGWQWHGGRALERAGFGAPYVHTDYESMVRAMQKVCPYGVPGDRLWTREAWRSGKIADPFPPREMKPHVVWYEADGPAPEATNGKLRPGIFMPRWACRSVDEVTDVRVQRLQDISEADAIAEGCHPSHGIHGDDDIAVYQTHRLWEQNANMLGLTANPMPIARYAVLWESINGVGSWSANPWIWAVSFRSV